MQNNRFTGLLTILGTLCTLTSALAQHKVSYTTVDYPGFANYNAPLGINNRGDIAGFYNDASGAVHGYIRVDGKFTSIDVPNSISTYCSSISLNGDVTGTYFDPMGFQHGYLLHRGHFKTIDVPGAVQTTGIDFELGPGLGTAAAVHNEEGDIVGEYAGAEEASHGWVLAEGRFHTIDPPGEALAPGLGSAAVGINNCGEIVGVYYTETAPYVHAYLYARHRFEDLVAPASAGTFGTQANGINDRGDIVGLYGDTQDNTHGFLRRDGKYLTVDFPGAVGSECHVINDRGEITGLYVDANNVSHGFIATVR